MEAALNAAEAARIEGEIAAIDSAIAGGNFSTEAYRLVGEIGALDSAITGGNFSKELVNVMLPYRETLSGRLQELTGMDWLGAGKDEEERKKRNETAIEIAEQIAQDHQRFMTDGFQTKQDFFTFGKNLENDDYWNYLQDNPEERKKVANNFVDGLIDKVKKGEMSAQEAAAAINQNERTRQIASEADNYHTLAETLEKGGVSRADLPQPSQELSGKFEQAKGEQVAAVIDGDNQAFMQARKDKVEVKSEFELDSSNKANAKEVSYIEKTENQAVELDESLLADLGDLKNNPVVKTASAQLQKAKMQEVAEVEPAKLSVEEQKERLKDSNVQDRGEVERTETLVAGTAQNAEATRSV